MEFNEKKQLEIEKLEKINKVLTKIINSPVSLLDSNELLRVQHLLEKNKTLIDKLKKDEFEIAIVGLEKAGKSTFANALIKADILPSAPDRCTFTSTKLMYSPEDRAVVSFYTREEFNKIFRSMLRDLEYPNAENIDFMSMDLSEFERYFNSLEESNPLLYKEHLGKTDEEIKDILKYKIEISKLLNTPSIEFRGEDLKSKEFKEYITGVKLENGMVDTSKPRAVKNLEIYSSNLNELKSAIIYDVPGFDSPTKIHERQTLERLKKADIIVLVTNVGDKPNLNSLQLNIITKNTDEDGIPLRDKLFIFGNKIDLVNKKEDIENNKNTLINDVLKYKIGVRDRIYIGSAYKYLVENGLKYDPTYNCKFNISSGIDEIREGIIKYYQNERFKILKRRIEKVKEETLNLRDKLREQFESSFDKDEAERKKYRVILDEVERIKRNIKVELENIRGEIKRDIKEGKYFSNKFKENIESEEYFPKLTSELFEKIKKEEDITLSTAQFPEAVNDGIRKNLYNRYLNNFVSLIFTITDTQVEKIHERVIKSISKAILGDASFDTKEVEKEIKSFMRDLNSEIMHDSGRFLYLIERFSRPVFDGLILKRVLSEDRQNLYKEYEKEFRYLDSYYSNGEEKLLVMMLGGEESTLKKTAKQINSYVSRNPAQKKSVDTFIDSVLNDLKKATTDEAIIDEINRDIENLKKILSTAVIEAVNLELAFLNSLDKEIKTLMDSFENRESKNLSNFNDFISKIVSKLKKGELNAIDFEIEQNKLKKEIVEDLFSIGI